MTDLKKLAAALEQLARQAGDALPEGGAVQAECKTGVANFVTEYDKATQQRLFEGCLALVPDAVLIGEESYDTGGVLPDAASFARSFVIDPIDGTTNFIHGYRHSAISIGYLEYGVVMVGVVYDPSLRECFVAVRGGGAVCNGVPMRVSAYPTEKALVSFGTSPYYADLRGESLRLLAALLPRVADLRRSGSAALDLAYVAAGRTDAFFELRLSPWDYAAGSLLVEEAGGRAAALDGTPLAFDRCCSLLAASPTVYDDIRRLCER